MLGIAKRIGSVFFVLVTTSAAVAEAPYINPADDAKHLGPQDTFAIGR